MAIGYFYLTGQGQKVVEKLNQCYEGKIFDKTDYKDGVKQLWETDNILVFVMASGIVVRTIAPWIQSKTKDPAVLVIDQDGRYVISLLSGHLGGANAAAEKMAEVLGASAVITTATDVAGVPAVDVVAKENGLEITHLENLKYVSSAMVEHRPLNVITQWMIDGKFPDHVDVFYLPESCQLSERLSVDRGRPVVIIGTPSFCCHMESQYHLFGHAPAVLMAAKTYFIGTGCKKNMDSELYEAAFNDFMNHQKIWAEDIRAVATIDMKAEEVCIQKLAKKLGIPVKVYSKAILEQVDLQDASGQVIEASAFVQSVTGVGSVSEASAYLASGKGRILTGKTKYQGITFALAEEKKVIRL